ncbi:3-dehydroshikimate dehydratase [Pontiella desulfatans]|uniref:3-dehydroshikimate dehydratase n=1 Tax=Pontiella desulfatans TaxID=2750659 RepID=A0A6C2UAJ8_PONDE|nr:TIM barrel protein [Pontiella desulfatans]VGO16541.1 3-dehydroshikimate dehydratase [Pontiella desulfatans]
MKTGLCSITLRQLDPAKLVSLVRQSGLDAIEWGGDVHVPPGALEVASDVRKMTLDAGLEVSSYGSYWKVVDAAGKPDPFEPVLESAMALGTDTIRIWAGHKPSDAVSASEREAVVDGMRHALDAAKAQGIKLALEFHANTLSDSNAATLDVLNELNHSHLFTYWQPIYWLTDPAYRLAGLQELSDRVLNLHVFHWLFSPGAGSWGDSTNRRPLEEGAADWETYFQVPLDPSCEHYALIEFVRGDDPEQFLRDAAALKAWLPKEKLETVVV